MAVEPNLKLVDPVSSPEWRELVETFSSSIFHSPGWMRVVQSTYGIDMSAAVIERDGSPVAGVVWSESNDMLGPKRTTLPYSDFCDVLGDDAADRLALARFVLSKKIPWMVRTFDGNLPDLGLEGQGVRHFKWHGLDLAPSEDELLQAMNSNSKRGIKKARNSGVEVRSAASKDELREWFLLHLRLRKYKHHLLAQPYFFFEKIWDDLIAPGNGFLSLAYHEGKVVGGTLYLTWKDTCYYKFNASDSDSLSLRPNNLLTWAGIQEAKARGCKLLDFGRSSASQKGLIEYKAGYGAKERDIFAREYVPEGAPVTDTSDCKQMLGGLTSLFISPDVPDDVSEQAGALLYKYFK